MSSRITLLLGALLLVFAGAPPIVGPFTTPVVAAANDQPEPYFLDVLHAELDKLAVRGFRELLENTHSSEIRAAARGQNCRLGPNLLPADPLYPYGVTYPDLINFSIGPGDGDDPWLLTAPGGLSNAPFKLYSLGDRTTLLAEWPGPSVPIPGGPSVAIGNLFGDATPEVVIGGLNTIEVMSPRPNNRVFFSFSPFADYQGGVRVAVADVAGKDGRSEIIATQDDGGKVAILGVSDERAPFVIAHGEPYGPAVKGVWASATDLNRDGFAEIFLGSGSGPGIVGVLDPSRGGVLIGRINAFPDATTGARVDGGFIEGRPVVVAVSGGQFRAFGASPTTDEWEPLDFLGKDRPFGSATRDVNFDMWFLDNLPVGPGSGK
jgi:hypothetical protein